MKQLRVVALLVFVLALLAAGCGGGGGESLPEEDVALVGNRHITFAQLDMLMAQAERSYKLQKREFPKAGSTEYRALQTQALQSLVQKAQLDQKAEELDIRIEPKQIDDRLTEIKRQYFGGDQKRYEQELKRQGVTEEQVRDDVRSQLVSEAIFEKVTADVKVSEADITTYYRENTERYTQPETREVRHILVKDQKTANRLYERLRAGADFAALAKEFSEDPGSKTQGGKLTITRGQTVKEFDETAFALDTNELSKPVKTQFGWHIIQALKPATKKKVTPLKDVKEAIRQQLLSERRNKRLTEWYDEVKKEFESRTKYAKGFGPLDTGSTTTGATTTAP